jgi:hypothetical protein
MTLVAGKNCFKPQRRFKASPRKQREKAADDGRLLLFLRRGVATFQNQQVSVEAGEGGLEERLVMQQESWATSDLGSTWQPS